MSFETWYLEIPIITRCYFTISVVTTLACYFDLISPFTLYLNYRLIWEKMEVRLPTYTFQLSLSQYCAILCYFAFSRV